MSTDTNVVPDAERESIVQEAKSATIIEIVSRTKSIGTLEVTTEYAGKKLEIEGGESILVDTIVEDILNTSGPFWEEEDDE